MFPAALYAAVSFAQTVRTVACDEADSVCTAALRPGYRIVFSDEFNGADGTLPDHRVWKNCKRRPSVTWARFLSSSPAVAFQEGGSLVLRAVPDPDRPTDEAAMLTGGIETSRSFSFRFGRVEWGENALTFYMDGRQVYQYTKQNDSQEQWPFDKSDFYLILNQSVGDGSWAEKPDSTHTYEMRIDWIRVYQREETVSNNVIVPVSGGSDSMKTYLLQVGGNGKGDCRLPEGDCAEGGQKSVG